MATSRHAFERTNVKEFINRWDLKFDLVVVELFTHESWLMFGHKFKAPIVGLSKYIYTQQIANVK